MGPNCVRLLIVVVLTASPVVAQMDARGLQDALKGKQLVLRNYSADKVAHYRWVDGKLIDAPASMHTLGVFVPSGVKEKGEKLSISGSRSTLIRDTKNNKMGLAGKSNMEIEIDLNGADVASVLPQLRDAIFFPDVAAAIAGLPKRLVRSVPAPVPPQASVDPCHCQQVLRDGEWVKVPEQDKRMTPPTLIRKEDPEYTSDARAANVNGSVRLMMVVDAKGEPTDLWLLVPLGYGLDESAEKAVQTYRFTPARDDNQPVGFELIIEVTFKFY
jgi:TonB family protein